MVLHRLVLHNDRIHEASDTVLAPGQVGLLSGWGVFSTLKVADGVLFAFERHWARISRDAAAMHVPLPGNPETLHRRLLELVEANGAYNSTLRLVIVRNGGGMWAGPSNGPHQRRHRTDGRLQRLGRGRQVGASFRTPATPPANSLPPRFSRGQ
ncbi:MAG: aminotransferase class IV [Ignavibacteriota bacterium]